MMKNYLLKCILGAFLFLGIVSCNSEETVVAAHSEQEMTVEMKNFKAALIDWVKAKNSVTQNKGSGFNPNDVIITEAIDLLQSEKIVLESKTMENKGALISQAMRVYVKKTNLKK